MVISAAKFKAQCLQLMEQVKASRVEITVTKRGVPVAKLVPVDPTPPTHLLGYLKGSVTVTGDILETGENWETDRRD